MKGTLWAGQRPPKRCTDMAQDIVSWLIDHPESKAVGHKLQNLIGAESQLTLAERQARVSEIQIELEDLKSVLPQDEGFLRVCIHAVGQIAALPK